MTSTGVSQGFLDAYSASTLGTRRKRKPGETAAVLSIGATSPLRSLLYPVFEPPRCPGPPRSMRRTGTGGCIACTPEGRCDSPGCSDGACTVTSTSAQYDRDRPVSPVLHPDRPAWPCPEGTRLQAAKTYRDTGKRPVHGPFVPTGIPRPAGTWPDKSRRTVPQVAWRLPYVFRPWDGMLPRWRNIVIHFAGDPFAGDPRSSLVSVETKNQLSNPWTRTVGTFH